jgi:two-component system, OmpR family, sensor histidine kinase VicK
MPVSSRYIGILYLYSRKSNSYITKAYTEPARTDIIHGIDNVVDTISHCMSNAKHKIDACVDYTRPSLAIEINQLRDAFLDAKTRGVKIRYLTEITKDNLRYCKELVSLVSELRHLDGIKGSFYINEQEYAAPATYHEKGKSANMMIHSTVKEIVEHQQYVFDTIWNTSTSAERKIKEIESEGSVSIGITEIIDHSFKTQELFINLIKSAESEILLILPTVNAFMREYRIGAIQLLKELSTNATQKGTPLKENLQKQGIRRAEVSIRILTPTNDDINKIINNTNITTTSSRLSEGEGKVSNKANNSLLQIRYLESLPKYNVTTATILVVDRKISLVMEKVDDSKESFVEAVGLSTYSTSEPTIMSYVSIFENFWNQIELYDELKESKEKLEATNEQLKEHDKMQREFINIASHELKTPTQAILGYSTLIQRHPERRDEMIRAIERNAIRLQSLTNSILDVSRIDSQTLKLNKEKFNINEKIRNVVEDIKSKGDEIEIAFTDPKVDPIVVEADKIRIYEVISNLLTNAIKFTQKSYSDSSNGISTITIFTDIKSNQAYKKGSSNSGIEEVIISIRDRGMGINPNVQEKLFSKFVTTSETGSGLGLFISKGIVEAHGGRIWAENNADGKGATFAFSLPLSKEHEPGGPSYQIIR